MTVNNSFNKGIKTQTFGEHITIDGYGGSKELLTSKENVLGALNELPELLGMGKLCEPVIAWAEPNHIKDPGGWSGIVMIVESHISMHTFPSRGFISADVYTCKNGMNLQYILDFFTVKFGLKEIEHNHIIRGTRYPVADIYSDEEEKKVVG